MTQREAVLAGCKELGVQTSLKTLAQYASLRYGRPIAENTACIHRREWCRLNGIPKADCRTYEGQHRRNMLDDKKCSWECIKIIQQLCCKLKVSGTELATMVSKFHSIDQFALHCQE